MNIPSPQDTVTNLSKLEESTKNDLNKTERSLRRSELSATNNISESRKNLLLQQQKELVVALEMIQEDKSIVYTEILDNFLHSDTQEYPSFKKIPKEVIIKYIHNPDFQKKVRLSQLNFNTGVINALEDH